MVAELKTMQEIVDTQSWRRAGCSDLCGVQRVIVIGTMRSMLIERHDPGSHEAYGLALADTGHSIQVIGTGPLTIRQHDQTVFMNGETLTLTPLEYRILNRLAQSLDRFVSHDQMVASVWGTDWWDKIHYGHHVVRVHMSRLRKRLGEHRDLIETRPSYGYRLKAVPHTGPEVQP